MQLVPFGSDRAPLAGSYRVIITSCWNAPGLNHKPPAAPNLLEATVCSRRVPGVAGSLLSQAHSRNCSVPIREYCFLPHVEHVLLPMMSVLRAPRPLNVAVIRTITSARILLLIYYMQ